MDRTEKREFVASLAAVFADTSMVVVTQNLGLTVAEVTELRRRMRAHPCHQCPEREDHARWAARWWQLRRETDDLQRRVSERTHTVARTFERICDLLAQLGYLSPDGRQVTPEGHDVVGHPV